MKAGLKSKTILASDPAFTLETKENEDAEEIIGSNTVGINLSPLVLEDGNAILFDAFGPKCLVIISMHINESQDIKIPPSKAIHSV